MNEQTLPEAAYPVDVRNRVKRRHDRGAYDHASVHAVLDAGMLAHVSYVIDGQPYCTPTIHWREGTRLYWHGSSASRMLRAQAGGVPVCVTVAMLDGLVMARTGMNHSANYRSVMCFGEAALVEGAEEKSAALLAMIDRYFPGRNATLREFSAQDIKATKVVGMEIAAASAKVRADLNHDEPEDLDNPTWAGVIPVSTVIGAPEPCPHNGPEAIRSGLDAYAPGRRLDEAMVELAHLYEGAAR
ncbi:pyridoxamine 5'-phosphate oxidase family protein [Albimonas sp. CAU 1670]|uniref:pyridoxamine 5'-phosphate oxidase family protein n=1 Tax=Albimonas sp. CAU 1670 TaxID=3032599 RepID=UPI0023DB48B8|nr:pyridoxamine 5'-phosphate oxidase family protein [Albimonas sp. CAU 1670]MDF2231914.1 pyridoxamine 5'-phosphate oxidase family protein [Albimonas sp. CAU 1670]